ncbi:ADP-glyceromanno-heptose 6-epimerase [Sphingomonas echinoides]|uniref:ADP-L-glycero-D-manno-heptose-6-epimerase n=1 Tax=Sphingomonas echinoides TaxID=59803 RepID=A0ABU4PR45_9SPHN|nr:ADP-glyceromanno-heptose 6-epimerase [Sphingomonas echinoides]MDX5986611.1 ADP-glyceromanno-heptose 6-epimerase [Sphingomonas echinoides]
MIIVTGGAGMIGSGLVHALNAAGECNIIVVDDLTDGIKFRNLVDADIADYLDRDEFLHRMTQDADSGVRAIFHQGACSATTEWDGRFMMERNFTYSKTVFEYAQRLRIPLIYASSAAVYGGGGGFRETPEFERPLNVYGWSKKLFDDWVRRRLHDLTAPVVGLRYFNVYGPRENHKGAMASVAFHLFNQVRSGTNPKLFGAYDGYGAGEQSRDFIHVDDVAAVNIWAWRSGVSGIFNCGTGRAEPFRTVAQTVIDTLGTGAIEFIDFPDHLKGRYQSFTQADLTQLRAAGYGKCFRTVASGTSDYIAWLSSQAL